MSSGSGGVGRRRCRVLPHNYPVYAYSLGPLDTPKSGARRASSSAQSQCRCRSRERILHDAGQLAAARPHRPHGRGGGPRRRRVTPDRLPHFDSPGRLLEALAWSVLERPTSGRVRQARMHPTPARRYTSSSPPTPTSWHPRRPRQGGAGHRLGRPDVRAIIQGTYVTARRAAITELVDDSSRPAGFSLLVGRTGGRCLMVLTSLEAFETLTVHSGWATTDAPALLAELAARVLDAWRPPSTRQGPGQPRSFGPLGSIAPFASRPVSAQARGATAMEVTPAMGPLGAAQTRGGISRRNRAIPSGPSRPATEPGGLLAVGPDGPGRAGWRPRPAPAAVVQGPAAARPGGAGRGNRRPATVGPASSTTPPRRSARAAPGSARTWLWHGAADEEVPILALASPSSPDHSISHDDVADPHGQPGYSRSPGERRRWASRARASAAEAP